MRWRAATASRVIFIGQRNGLVVKLRPRLTGRAECKGYKQIAPYFPIPRLLVSAGCGRKSISVFLKSPTVARDSGLLADALRRDLKSEIENLVESHTEHLARSIGLTGAWTEPANTVSALYQDRARLRLRDWWHAGGGVSSELHTRLQEWSWRIEEVPVGVKLGGVLQELVEWADSREPIFTILSQGDPNEMNLAVPLAYLDFKYSGRNALVGEIANFCWALLGQGGYYAPTYNRTSFHGHPRILNAAPANRPIVDYRLDEDRKIISVRCDYKISSTRRAAALGFLDRILPHVSAQYADKKLDPIPSLTRFLLARILLTFDPRTMTVPDLVFIAASAVSAYTMGGVGYLEGLAAGEIL